MKNDPEVGREDLGDLAPDAKIRAEGIDEDKRGPSRLPWSR
jgi:hypothetical protein